MPGEIALEPAPAEPPSTTPFLLNILVSEVSAAFIDLAADEIDRGMDTALKITGESLHLERCFVGLFSPDRQQLNVAHGWRREPGRSPIPPTLAVSALPHTLRRISAGHDFLFESLSRLDASVQKEAHLLGSTGVAALVCMPLRIGREIIGLVCFASARTLPEWPSAVLISLRLTVEIVANALDRRNKDAELRAQQELDAMVARVSRDFVNMPVTALDEVMTRALADVARTLRCDRALIFRTEAASSWICLWHEWLAPGMSSLRPDFARIARSENTYIPLDYQAGEGVIVDLACLPDHAVLYHRLKAYDVRLVAMAPLIDAGRNFGTLILHHRTLRAFSADFCRQLTLLGELFASVICRVEAERARARAFEELEALKVHIERERDYLREEVRRELQVGEILGSSAAMRVVLDAIAAVAPTQATVLIRGESGVGKELIARAIHDHSPRRDGALVKVNCASIPRELFESEFFGHVRGAFTGAHKDRAGRFELADRGTLFLDEVGDIPLDLQAKLLRVLQEGEYERIGEERTRHSSARVIAATNRDLAADIAAGRFRCDLYYRLNTFPISVPPLRERGDDVIGLARHFLALYARNTGKSGLVLDKDHEAQLRAYSWQGNVRELQHVLERAVILSTSAQLRLDLALPKLPASASPPRASVLPRPLAAGGPLPMNEFRQLERDNLVAALEKTHWRIAGAGGAAELLGLPPSTLRDRIRALRIGR